MTTQTDFPPLPDGRSGRDRFWPRVAAGPDEACWPWLGSTHGGYGQIRVAHQMTWAHRVAYELANGPIPLGFDVHHRCRSRSCCNPAHLELLRHDDHARRHKPPPAACPRCGGELRISSNSCGALKYTCRPCDAARKRRDRVRRANGP